jgi:two-component system phosphate regulon sensor histidine kinase PhoR
MSQPDEAGPDQDRPDNDGLADDLEWIRNRVLNVIGHELRTPVTTVRGLADALATSSDPATRAKIVAALQRNSRRLERLVDDLLTAVEVKTALPVGDPKPVPLSEVTRQVWEEVAAPQDDTTLEIDANGAPEGYARPVAVRRILGQVLRNAATYGSSPVTVHILAGGRPAAQTVRIEVDSPGPPPAPEDVRYALEPFWRGERAVTTAPGLGLGLTIAKVLAEHEHGALRVATSDGGGFLTSIELPAT